MDICVFIHETLFVRLYVCLSDIPSFPTDRFGKLLHNADKRMANKTEVYFERNNLQFELSRCRNNVDFIHVYFEKRRQIPCNIAHRTQIRRFRTQTTLAPFLTVYAD